MLDSKQKNFCIKTAVTVTALALLFIAGFGSRSSAPDQTMEPRTTEFDFLARELNVEALARTGDFPHAILKDLAGKPFELSGHRGKIVLLSFWASWCPACNQELPLLQALYDALGAEGLLFVGANFQEDARTVESYVRQKGYTFPVVMDANGEAFDRLQAAFLPTTFVITKHGELLGKIVGHRDWHSTRIRAAFEQALRNPT